MISRINVYTKALIYLIAYISNDMELIVNRVVVTVPLRTTTKLGSIAGRVCYCLTQTHVRLHILT